MPLNDHDADESFQVTRPCETCLGAGTITVGDADEPCDREHDYDDYSNDAEVDFGELVAADLAGFPMCQRLRAWRLRPDLAPARPASERVAALLVPA